VSNLAPRQVAWVESMPSRVLMTGAGPLPVYQGEVVVIVVAKDAAEARKLIGGEK
jgi:uncharacterized membrane protein